MVEANSLEEFLSRAEAPAATNGATIVNAVGSVLTGATGIVEQGTSLSGYRHLAITAKNKPGSLSALTFSFVEVNSGIGGSVSIPLGSARVSVGSTGYSYVATQLGGLSSTLTITVTADPAQPSGEDNFAVTVTGYTS